VGDEGGLGGLVRDHWLGESQLILGKRGWQKRWRKERDTKSPREKAEGKSDKCDPKRR